MECQSKLWSVIFRDRHIVNISASGEVIPVPTMIAEVLSYICFASRLNCKFYSADYDKAFDMFAGALLIHGELSEYGEFPYAQKDMSFAALNPEFADKSSQIFKVFSVYIWVGIVIIIIFISSFYYVLFERKIHFLLTVFHVFGSFTLQYHDWKPKYNAQKIFVMFSNWGIMLITVAYASVLLSLVTMPVRKSRIETLDELYQALVEGKVRVTDFDNVNTYGALSAYPEEKLQFIAKVLQRTPSIVANKATEIVTNRSLVIVSGKANLEYSLNENYYISKNSLSSEYTMFLVNRLTYPEKRPCHNIIRRNILIFWSSGMYGKLFFENAKSTEKLKHKYKLEEMREETSAVKSVSLSDLTGIFYILLLGHVLAIICLLIERITTCFL